MNKIYLSGRVVSIPKFGKTKNNDEYLSFSLSITKENSAFIKQYFYLWCTSFEFTVIEQARKLKKGDEISLEGSLNLQEINNIDSKFKRYNYSIGVNSIEILNSTEVENKIETKNINEENSNEITEDQLLKLSGLDTW
ncbi:single-stranded DNA-binding protein [Metamycoplasma equirhinis]|uniref:single-stranded DNA-binding protein n=1 Tax=Metamycoplasma equirhinis TaxID=92402 RepID=UPI002573A817|nr:single-stranded DNA-binding protein [Metamycoplasma equirhinis]BDX52601.1 hypothetical protein JPM7_2080 [Metamycoplasma equirhinis]